MSYCQQTDVCNCALLLIKIITPGKVIGKTYVDKCHRCSSHFVFFSLHKIIKLPNSRFITVYLNCEIKNENQFAEKLNAKNAIGVYYENCSYILCICIFKWLNFIITHSYIKLSLIEHKKKLSRCVTRFSTV